MSSDDFMNFMGYRNCVLENKIDECMAAIQRGETDITITRDSLTDSELGYLQSELTRRLNNR